MASTVSIHIANYEAFKPSPVLGRSEWFIEPLDIIRLDTGFFPVLVSSFRNVLPKHRPYNIFANPLAPRQPFPRKMIVDNWLRVRLRLNSTSQPPENIRWRKIIFIFERSRSHLLTANCLSIWMRCARFFFEHCSSSATSVCPLSPSLLSQQILRVCGYCL